MRGANLRDTNLCGATLSGANLRDANLCEADLSGVNLRGFDLRGTNLSKTNLLSFDLREADLSGADLSGANLIRAYLRGANLREADLREANLSGATLREANLGGADLHGANLNKTDLSKTQVLRTNFEKAEFTAACLEDWNINSATKFDGAICEYAYLKTNQQERRPREGIFKPGEFAALFQRAIDTVDLIFKDGIDWQAFFQSFQNLRSQYADQNLSIQAIEKKRDGAFVIRLELPPEVNKAKIESRAKELYAVNLQTLEAQYEERLRLQGKHLEDARNTIEIERREKSTLVGVITTMANSQKGPKYDMRGAQFAGGFAEKVRGDQIGGTQHNYAAPKKQNLADAALEIQHLLKQLEATNPTATEAEQKAFVTAAIPLTLRQRAVSALQSGGKAVVEELLDNPYVNVAIAVIEGWQSAD